MKEVAAPFWKEAPFVRLVIPLSGGIILQELFNLTSFILTFSISIILIVFIVFRHFRVEWQYKFRWVQGCFIVLLIISMGALLTFLQNPLNDNKSLIKTYKPGDVVLTMIEEPLLERNKSYKAIVSVLGYIRGNQLFKATGKMILYFSRDAVVPSIRYGTQVMLFKKPEKFRNSGNPGSMDYERYAFMQGYMFQTFITKKDFVLLPRPSPNHFKKMLIDAREHICATLRKYIPGAQEYGLAEALLIGYKEDLDRDLIRAYTNTGVVHVIAISGLHLGLLYVIFKGLIYPITFVRRTKWLKSIIIILILWIFSLMTGGSPSVLRSAVMFTAILAGESLTKKISIYNCLGASAFVLLCYKPYWLFDIGFQLSYSAVLSIVIFMKPVHHLLFVPNKILDYFWQLCAVTIAAQILTTPVSLYYFHQFPVFFIIANFIAVPLSGLILISELILCGLYIVQAVASPMGKITGWCISIMNKSIIHIDELPYSIISNIRFDFIQLLLIYIGISSLTIFLFHKKKAGLYFFLIAGLFIISISSIKNIQHRTQQMFIVYHISKSHLSEIITGNNAFIRSRIDPESVDAASKAVTALHSLYKISNIKKITHDHNLLKFGGSTILFVDSNQEDEFDIKDNIHLIVISGNNLNCQLILDKYQPDIIVMDASNSFHNTNTWKTACKKRSIRFHDVADKGAFVMTVN